MNNLEPLKKILWSPAYYDTMGLVIEKTSLELRRWVYNDLEFPIWETIGNTIRDELCKDQEEQ